MAEKTVCRGLDMNRPAFIPREYQHAIVDHILNVPRCAIWAGMGMGKSSGTLDALNELSLIEDPFPALITAPLRVANSVWPEEVEKWSTFNHLRVQPVTGTVAQRTNALKEKADIYSVNYENIPWLIETLDGKWPYKTIGADESTKLAGFRSRQGTSRSRALATVAFKSDRFIELTGTPAPNGLQKLWGQIFFLDQGERLGRTFTAFTQRWFRQGYDGFSLEPLAHADKEIHARLSDICLSLEAKDYFDLYEPIINKIYVDLPIKARRLYVEMEKEMYIQIEDEGIEAFNAASRTNKCQQLANGAAYVGEDAEKWVEVHDEKIQALESIIEEAAGMPVLVAYHFRSDLSRLRSAFPKGRVLDKSPQTLRDWNAGRIPLLFVHPASAGHGLNLQDGGNILVYFAIDWNLENHMQILERIGPTRQLQAGHDRPVFVHMILARDTVDDELILPRLEGKRTVQEVLMTAMKRRKK